MDAVLRALAVFLILLVLFRLSGKRTLSQVTTFDFVLLLIVSGHLGGRLAYHHVVRRAER